MENGKILSRAFLCFIVVFGLILSVSGCGTSSPVAPVAGEQSFTYWTSDPLSSGSVMILNTPQESVVSMVAGGYMHRLELSSNGTVVAVGDNSHGQCNVGNWTDITQVDGGDWHTVGLKSDGTVVATGLNDRGQCDVGNWTDIIQVAAGHKHTVGLYSDGTVVAVGQSVEGQCNVGNWTDIIQVDGGDYHTVGLCDNGTVVAVGSNALEQSNVGNWTDITQISAGHRYTVGLKSDGTLVAVGLNFNGQCNVGNWTDITEVDAGNKHTVGLKSDGTVVAVGRNNNGQCNVAGWEDIIQVSADGFYTVGLKSDGTVVLAPPPPIIPPSVSVATSTGTGTASFTPSAGNITALTAVITPSGAPVLPHGLFSFNVTGLSPGQNVTITVELPDPVPLGTKWWKYQNGSWYWLPIGSDDGDNIITVALQDGVFPGDEDSIPGQITDDGGPGTGAVGWETHPVNKVRVLLPWIALVVAIMAGVSLLVLRRRRAQS